MQLGYPSHAPPGYQYTTNIGGTETLLKSEGTGFKSVVKNNAQSEGATTLNVGLAVSSIVLPAIGNPRRTAILGRCSFGSGNARMFFDFDWHQGTQFSVQASSIDILASLSEVSDDDNPDRVTVSASITEGSRAARSQVTRTFYTPLLTVGADIIIPVPPFAHAFYLFSPDTSFFTLGAVDVFFQGGPDAGDQVQHELDASEIRDAIWREDGARFPEQTRFLRFSTISEGAPFEFYTVFTLSV